MPSKADYSDPDIEDEQFSDDANSVEYKEDKMDNKSDIGGTGRFIKEQTPDKTKEKNLAIEVD
jgi:hypothetical protein